MQLFQINQSEESSKITINAHTTSCPLHQLPITSAAHYNRIYSTYIPVSGSEQLAVGRGARTLPGAGTTKLGPRIQLYIALTFTPEIS